MMWHDLIEVH